LEERGEAIIPADIGYEFAGLLPFGRHACTDDAVNVVLLDII
jgi:hypothetical protein